MSQDLMGQKNEAQQQAQIATFFEALPDATLLVEPSGKIVLVNTQVEVLFGYLRTELLGRPVEILIPRSLWEQYPNHQINDNATPQPQAVGGALQLFVHRKDGSEFPVDITFSPFNAHPSHPVLIVMRDISRYAQERKRAESEMVEVQHRLIDGHEAERQQLAQELHDGPLQELHSVDFGLVSLARQLDHAEQQAQVKKMRIELQNVSRQLRGVCQDLRPPALHSFGLSAVIQSCAEGLQQWHPELKVALDLASDEQRLPERVRLALYRICQQTVKNIGQHASAKHVQISLQLEPEQVKMTLEDDGQGVDLPNSWLALARHGHYGLIGCKERAEAVGGRFEVISAPGQGFKAQAVVPLTANSVNLAEGIERL